MTSQNKGHRRYRERYSVENSGLAGTLQVTLGVNLYNSVHLCFPMKCDTVYLSVQHGSIVGCCRPISRNNVAFMG